MYYKAVLEIPANTPETSAIEEVIALTRGRIKRIHVGFPPGCAGLAHITITDKGWQIVPWTPLESIGWDGIVFDMPMEYDLDVEPYELTVKGWNEDDAYTHTVWVGIVFDEQKVPGSETVLPLVISQGAE